MTRDEKQWLDLIDGANASTTRANAALDEVLPTFQEQALALETWQHGHQMKMAALTAQIAALEASQGHDHAEVQTLEAERLRLSLELREGSPVSLTRHTLRDLIGRTALGDLGRRS